MSVGKVVQVIGPTVDVAFDPDKLPRIYNAIVIEDAKRGRLTRDITMFRRIGATDRWRRSHEVHRVRVPDSTERVREGDTLVVAGPKPAVDALQQL